jgi:hypothetical protein
MTEDNKNLIPLGNGTLPAIIERRTQIANRVLGQLSTDQTEAFFRKYPDFFMAVVSRHYQLDMELIELILLVEKHQDNWYGGLLSQNETLPWSIDFIECFEERWDWREGLSRNTALPWSLKLIECYKERWNWGDLSRNKALPWSIDLIDCYKERWDWRSIWSGSLSKNIALPWSINLIDSYKERWDWEALSQNIALPWSLELIERYKERWDWSIFK